MEHARGTGVREGMENDHPGRVAMWRRESRVCSRGRAPRDRPVATPDSLRAHRASRSLRSGSWRSPVRRPLIVRTPSRRAPPASTQTKSSLCPAHRRATALRPDGRAQTQPAPHTRRTGPPRPADVEAGVRPTCRVAAPRGGMVAARGCQGGKDMRRGDPMGGSVASVSCAQAGSGPSAGPWSTDAGLVAHGSHTQNGQPPDTPHRMGSVPLELPHSEAWLSLASLSQALRGSVRLHFETSFAPPPRRQRRVRTYVVPCRRPRCHVSSDSPGF